MTGWLKRLFTWWTGPTFGTALHTWRRGEKVGEDGEGNRYYRERGADRRWVLYHGEIEASRIPPEWHAWLHHLSALPPSEQPLPAKSWEKPHQPNPTGSPMAYFPQGSLRKAGKRPHATGDYEAWRP